MTHLMSVIEANEFCMKRNKLMTELRTRFNYKYNSAMSFMNVTWAEYF